MTAALPGFVAKLFIADSGLTTPFNAVAEARELTLDIEHEVIDATSHDSLEFREFIRGLRSWTITAGVLHLTGDTAGQTKIRAAVLNGVTLEVELREEGNVTGDPLWSGTVRVSATSLTFPNDDAMTGDITLQGTGVLTEGTVP